MAMILVADVGGTNARFQTYSYVENSMNLLSTKSFNCSDFASFDEILQMLDLDAIKPQLAVMSLAGVIYDNTVDLTNNRWQPINSDHIASKFKIPKVVFLNDFEGAAYGCLDLDPSLVVQLNPEVAPVPTGTKFVLGPGTGFGEALLTCIDSEYRCWSSEGSTCDMVPHNQEEWELCKYMVNLLNTSEDYQQFGYCEAANYEICLGGMGAFHFYNFYRERYPGLVNQEFDRDWDGSADKMKKMMQNGLGRTDKICEIAVRTWIRILAYECGNVIAKHLPFGGLYVVGGITEKNFDGIVSWKEEFFRAMETKPKHICEVIRKVPVFVVKDDGVGMKGALWYARRIVDKGF